MSSKDTQRRATNQNYIHINKIYSNSRSTAIQRPANIRLVYKRGNKKLALGIDLEDQTKAFFLSDESAPEDTGSPRR